MALAAEITGEGPPVVLIHGFPDSGAIWARQVEALVGSGFKTIVLDLPGCGDSSIPASLDGYRINDIQASIVETLNHLGVDHFDLVAHDWGAAISWDLIPKLDGRVKHFVPLQIGHFSAQMAAGEEQRMRYWYVWWFQFAGVVEECLQADDWKMFREWMSGDTEATGHPYPDTIIESLSRPGRLTAALNIYRAGNVDPRFPQGLPLGGPNIDCPTLGIYMSGDKYISPAGLASSGQYVDNDFTVVTVDDAGHFGQYGHAEDVNRHLLGFLEPHAG